MQLTVTVKLNTTPAQHDALVQTLRTCNAACDDISATAFSTGTFRQYDLHALVYHPVKSEMKLNANHVVRAIAKVAHAYKLDTKVQRTFAPLGGIELDKDLLTWKVDTQTVSINTVQGRLHLPFLCSSEHKALLQGKKGQTDLLLRDGAFYLSCAVTMAEVQPFTPCGIIGVDLGMVVRHEVAERIVWHPKTRPAVPSAVPYEVRRCGNKSSKALKQRILRSKERHPNREGRVYLPASGGQGLG
jgi:hypothetical protein